MRIRAIAALAFAAALLAAPAAAPHGSADSFVTQSGTRLLLDGRPFRFGGANVEWLGLIGYGPADPRSEERRVGKECRSRWSPYH